MPLIRIQRQRDTAVLLFARPPVNAFNLELVREFHQRLSELAVDVPSGGVVISGDGAAFSAGVDVKEAPGYGADQKAEMVGHVNAAITILYGLPTATVAAVNGHAIGGAFVVVLACDARVVAGVDAKLGLTEVTAGIPYPACPMEVVKAEIEPGYRRHLVLSGETLTPDTALARGLVDGVVPPSELMAHAVKLAQTRIRAPSYRRVKEQLKDQTNSRLREIVAGGQDPMLTDWL